MSEILTALEDEIYRAIAARDELEKRREVAEKRLDDLADLKRRAESLLSANGAAPAAADGGDAPPERPAPARPVPPPKPQPKRPAASDGVTLRDREAAVLEAIKDGPAGGVSKDGIVQRSGLGRKAVDAGVHVLARRGLIRAEGFTRSRRFFPVEQEAAG